MDEKYIKCTWKEFEGMIRNMIRSDFNWRISPENNPMNRKMILKLIREDIELNGGNFPDKNALIERIQDTGKRIHF